MEFSVFENIVREEFPFLSAEQLEQFRKMDALYRDWNSKINVISRKDIDGLYEHHVLHSLGIAAYLRRNRPEVLASLCGLDGAASEHPAQILDLGTGGGFPGIPLAILMPQAHFTLCDSIGKKLKVASGVAEALGLENVEFVNARAESLPQTFDYVVSRAVTTLEQFYPWVRGKFSRSILYLKGGDINEEVVTVMEKNNLKKGSVHCWKIDTWLHDEYFAEKFVIDIENN
jgi:16S rRNA (guanine527-N7)-methyltransferase